VGAAQCRGGLGGRARRAINVPDYSKALGVLQQGVDTATGRIDHVVHILSKAPVMAMTPKQMAQRIAA
jgi:hypothetical protein